MDFRISRPYKGTVEQRRQEAPATPFHLFEDFFNDWALNSFADREASYKPAVDIFEKGNKLILQCELPGIEEKDIDLRLDGRTITIRGERRQENGTSGLICHRIESPSGTFSRSFDLPDSADTENISASYAKGVLTITIPQKQEAQPRTIRVNA